MPLRSAWKRLLVCSLVAALPSRSASAEEDKKTHYVPKVEVAAEKVKKQGWKKKVDVGASVNFSQTSNVVGTSDGISTALGAQIKSAFDYFAGSHEWLNLIEIVDTFTYTSTIGEFVKTTDELKLRSAYLYHLKRVPWLGPYAELKLNTALFPARDVRSEPYSYVDAASDDVLRSGASHYNLTKPFSPLTLKEIIGAFARPLDKETIKLEARLGFSGRQTFVADDQWAVDKVDNDASPKQIRLKALESFYQGGPAAGLFLDGAVVDKKVLYFAHFETMVPAINSAPDTDDRNVGELTNISFEAGISVKLVTWASFSYTFKALREPQLVDAWQVQNNALLTFSYSLVD